MHIAVGADEGMVEREVCMVTATATAIGMDWIKRDEGEAGEVAFMFCIIIYDIN